MSAATRDLSAARALQNLGANPYNYGAAGDGSTDDTAAVQAAISSRIGGCPVVLPPGVFKITASLNLLKGSSILGSGMSQRDPTSALNNVCVLDASSITSAAVILNGVGNATSQRFENFKLKMADSTLLGSSEFDGVVGINPGNFSTNTTFRNLSITGGSNGIVCQYGSQVYFEGVWTDLQRTHGVALYQVQTVVSHNSIYANVGGISDANRAANFYLAGQCSNVRMFDPAQDEAFNTASCLYVYEASDVQVFGTKFFFTRGGYGVRVGPTSSRVRLSGVSVVPFNPALSNPTLGTIYLEGGTGHVLEDIYTDADGGTDITDNGTGTVWRNVNGASKFPGLPTSASGLAPGQLWNNAGTLKIA